MLWFGGELKKGRDEMQININTALEKANNLDNLADEQKAKMVLEVKLDEVR
jgi:hypothetical protein